MWRKEFNRYNQRKLVIEDPKLYGFHISGSSHPPIQIRSIKFCANVRGEGDGSERGNTGRERSVSALVWAMPTYEASI